jgi:cytochrome c551/c552
VVPQSHSLGDWVNFSAGGGRHAEEALFNMESCVACHDAGTDDPSCTRCHER